MKLTATKKTIDNLDFTQLVPVHAKPVNTHVEVRTEFSGAMTAEYAVEGVVNKYNQDCDSKRPKIKVDFLSAGDWSKASQTVMSNNFRGECRFQDWFCLDSWGLLTI